MGSRRFRLRLSSLTCHNKFFKNFDFVSQIIDFFEAENHKNGHKNVE